MQLLPRELQYLRQDNAQPNKKKKKAIPFDAIRNFSVKNANTSSNSNGSKFHRSNENLTDSVARRRGTALEQHLGIDISITMEALDDIDGLVVIEPAIRRELAGVRDLLVILKIAKDCLFLHTQAQAPPVAPFSFCFGGCPGSSAGQVELSIANTFSVKEPPLPVGLG